MRNRKVNIQEEEQNTLAFIEKLHSIKKASKDIKDRNKLTVHKVQWAREYKYLCKVERNMEKEVGDMLEEIDLRFSKELEEYQVFGRDQEKSYSELNKSRKVKVDTANSNLWFQVDSLRSVIQKIREAPEFYAVEEVQSIIESIRKFLDQLSEQIDREIQEVEIPRLEGNEEEEESVFNQERMLFATQVQGFDVKKKRILKMATNENIFQ